MENNKRIRKIKSDDDFIMLSLNNENEEDNEYIKCSFQNCNKKFKDNFKLKRHELSHNGERKYLCEYCGKAFSLDFNLKTHIRTHTGDKPYICKYDGCGKRFNQCSNLAYHEKNCYHNKEVYDNKYKEINLKLDNQVKFVTKKINLPQPQNMINNFDFTSGINQIKNISNFQQYFDISNYILKNENNNIRVFYKDYNNDTNLYSKFKIEL